MEEKKIRISENNVFHVNRKAIKEISEKENVDIGVAASMLTLRENWGKETHADRVEFDTYVSYLTRINHEDRNVIKRYFNGEEIVE